MPELKTWSELPIAAAHFADDACAAHRRVANWKAARSGAVGVA